MPADALPTPGVTSRPVQRSVARAVILRGALPPDVGTFTLTGGAFTDITGATALAGMKGTLQPVDGAGRAMSILHAASGKVIVPIAVPLEVQDDGTWSIGPLPYTDDPALAGPFRYRVSWNVSSSAPSPGNKIFEVPTGSGATVDFDLLGSATGTLVTPVAVPLVTSVAGESGAVTSADIAAGLDTDGTRLSAANLTATIDAEIAAQGGGAVADATATSKGVVQLAGDLAGTATAPTVPGLAAKADTASLAPVATSGAYADLTGKPTIPAAVQADTLITSADGTSAAGLWLPRGPRPMPAASSVITRDPAASAWTGGTADTTTKLFGTQSYKITTNGAGGSAYLFSPTFTAQDWSKSLVRVIFKVSDPTKVSQIQLYADTDASNKFVVNVDAVIVAGEWTVFTAPRAKFTVAAGTPSWTSITKLEFRTVDNSTGTVTQNLQAVELLPDQVAVYPNGVFGLECDDGYLGQMANLLPVTDSLGVPVTFNPIIERLLNGNAGFTAADLREWQRHHGWQVSCHAYAQAVHDYSPGGAIPAAMFEADVLKAKQWLHANGLHAGADDYAAAPGVGTTGLGAGALLDAVRRNYRSCRTTVVYQETVPPADPLNIRSILFTGNTVAQLQTNIDQAAGAAGALFLSLHDVIAGSTNGTSNSLPAIAANNLKLILQYAQGKGMAFRTRGDVLDLR